MNIEEFESLYNSLVSLNKNGCTGVKISFEDEGALFNEMIMMRCITQKANIELSIKIGGCESKRDLIDCNNLCCDTVVSPMIESSFAFKKYIEALKSCNCSQKRSFNLETIQGYINYNEIIPLLKNVNSITFGRVDFVKSLDRERDHVDSEEIYKIVHEVFSKAKEHKILCNLGGAISMKSKDFIKRLIEDGLIDYFETRYIIFKVSNIDMNNFEKLIFYANEFELLWMKMVNQYYNRQASKDIKRIEMIEERINENKA
jgi:hypothetical protein